MPSSNLPRSGTPQPQQQQQTSQPQQQQLQPQQQLQQPQQQQQMDSFTSRNTVPVTSSMGSPVQLPAGAGGLPASQLVGVGGAPGTMQAGARASTPGQPTVSVGPLNAAASVSSTVQTAQPSLVSIQPTIPAPGMGMPSANPAAPASSIAAAAAPTSLQSNFSGAPQPGFGTVQSRYGITQPWIRAPNQIPPGLPTSE